MNTASWCAYQGLPLPLLLVCEDNGLGISVRTPAGWIESVSSSRPRIKYFAADGADLAQTYDAAVAAADWVRERRAPAFLHVRTVRLGGHAGTDVESAYRTPAEIAADTARDPLLGTARLLVACRRADPGGRPRPVRGVPGARAGDGRRDRGRAAPGDGRAGDGAHRAAPPAILAANMAARSRHGRPSAGSRRQSGPDQSRQAQSWQAQPGLAAARDVQSPETGGPLTLAQAINRTLADEMADRPGMLVFGEDVARKGGVYGVTRGLLRTFGSGRVFDSPLDEQSILGMALGAGLAGLLPVPEIQYLAYLHNAADQIRGEAATLSFFSRAQYRNPLVVRVPGLAYQQGFGGHFHNDNGAGGAARHSRPGRGVPGPARRRGGDAAHLPGGRRA